MPVNKKIEEQINRKKAVKVLGKIIDTGQDLVEYCYSTIRTLLSGNF